MRLIETYSWAKHQTKVYRDSQNACYVVRVFSDNQENKDASYETNDNEDAHGTAFAMLRSLVAKDAPEYVITRRFEEANLTSEWYKDAQWQVIFKIKNSDGVIRDYCRETVIRAVMPDIEEVELWARDQCAIHRLNGAEIQLF